MKNFILFLFVSVQIFAQAIDTVKVDKVVNMEESLDSLRVKMREMDSELQRIKGNMVNKSSDVDELLFIDIEAIGGNGPSYFTESFSDPNGDSGSQQGMDGIDRLNVLEAWAEFNALQGSINITAGKIDLTNYFDNKTLYVDWVADPF